MTFKAGQPSQNPNGRARGARGIRKLAADRAFQAVSVLADVLESPKADAYSRVVAAQTLLKCELRAIAQEIPKNIAAANLPNT